MELEKFNKVLDEDYSVEIGNYISEGYELFKKHSGSLIGFVCINLLITAVCSVIPFIGGIASGIVSTFMYLGLYKTIRKMRHNQEVTFNDFFEGFKLDAGQVIGLTFVSGLLIIFGLILVIIPGIYLAVAYSFAIPLFSLVEKDFWGCMEMSRKIISKNWFGYFGFLLVLALLNLAGALCLIIGLLVTIPVSYCAIYIAFEKICQVNSLDDFENKVANLGQRDTDIQ